MGCKISYSLYLSLCFSIHLSTQAQTQATSADVRALVSRSLASLDSLLATPDQDLPRGMLSRYAWCLAVVPDYVRASFIVGGHYGLGMVTCRTPNNFWSAPSFFRIGGGGLGFQFGFVEMEMILVFTSRNAREAFLKNEFTFDASATASFLTLGRHGQAGSDLGFNSGIFAYVRASGTYVGASLQGSKIWPARSYIRVAYGSNYSIEQILMQESIPVFATQLISTISEYTRADATQPMDTEPVQPQSQPLPPLTPLPYYRQEPMPQPAPRNSVDTDQLPQIR